jgi:hypothetical protein
VFGLRFLNRSFGAEVAVAVAVVVVVVDSPLQYWRPVVRRRRRRKVRMVF